MCGARRYAEARIIMDDYTPVCNRCGWEGNEWSIPNDDGTCPNCGGDDVNYFAKPTEMKS